MNFNERIKTKHLKQFSETRTLIDQIYYNPMSFDYEILDDNSKQSIFSKQLLNRFNKKITSSNQGNAFYNTFRAGLICAVTSGAKFDSEDNECKIVANLGEYDIIVVKISDKNIESTSYLELDYPKNYIMVVRNNVLKEQLELHYGENELGFYMDTIRQGKAPIITPTSNIVGLESIARDFKVKAYDVKRATSTTTICNRKGEVILSKFKEKVKTPQENKVELYREELFSKDTDVENILDFNENLGLKQSIKFAEKVLPTDCYQTNLCELNK